MTEPFLIRDENLRALSATRQGRVSIAGYNYQAAYAVARLASMAVRQPVLALQDWPRRLRYDWGEDLDEACDGGTVIFTQCKRVATIGQPASLAEILAGFSPKWLWVPEAERDRLRFRLVCSDPRFAVSETWSDSLKAEVRGHFLTRLQKPAGQQSDRAVWMDDAAAVGHEALFEALWERFDCIYLPADVVDSEPAGPRLTAEKEALRILLEWSQIDSSDQTHVLGRLRRLIHDNLITFDPANESVPPSFDRSPRLLDRADVNAAIDPWRPTTQRRPPFLLVDRTFLSEQRALERKQFVARQPDWRDVAHGHDETIKFIERDQTAALEIEVFDKVVTRIGRAGKLPTLFVAGAPGDGKTTITRRVAARLVDSGKLLIADTGVGLHEPPGEPDEYVQAIERLQSFGRPLVLLLDDPLYADSPWLDVLRKLNRPGLQVGVLAASPQFLLDEHKAQLLRSCDLKTFEMARTSQHERDSLAALYGRSVSSNAEEDFLIVAMEAATGFAFSEIIARLWLTLADGRDLSSARNLSDLPWQTRAYLFVCFFSRAYEACPEPLLLKLLEMTGGVLGTSDVRTELQRMRYFAGWRIFRIGQRAWAGLDFQGAPITAAHTVIARQAWEQRPLPWCDVGGAIIEASVNVPQTSRDVSSLAVRLKATSLDSSTSEADDFAVKLLERWQQEFSIETRYLCDFVSTFSRLGHAEQVRSFREILLRRATLNFQGWLAALRLWFLRYDTEQQKEFPPELDVLSVIQSADFSIAPNRASQFGKLLEHDKPLLDAFVTRLFDAFDGKLSWKLDSAILTYLLKITSPAQLLPRVSQIEMWLEAHPEATDVRVTYLSFLLQLPQEFSGLRAEAARQTAEWLKVHDADASVRTQYLSFLRQLPQEFSGLRAKAARQTAEWLKVHDADASVRTQYLSFLARLPPEFSNLRAEAARQTAEWLKVHDADASVRTQYLSFLRQLPQEFSGLRAKAARQTAEWLAAHDENTDVRTQYLSFLRQLPQEFSGVRAEAARQTAEWLKAHDENMNVRTQYLSFLRQLPPEFSNLRAEAARQTAEWLAAHSEDTSVRTQYMVFLSSIKPVGEWQRLACDALRAVAELMVRAGWPRQHQILITSLPHLHLALLRTLKAHDSEAVRKVLQVSHDVVAEWYDRHPSEKRGYDLPLP